MSPFVFILLLLFTTCNGQSFTTKTISESTTIQGVDNTITITLRPSIAIQVGDNLTISGLTSSQTSDTGGLTIAGGDAAKVSSTGVWTQTDGKLVLTVATEIPDSADAVFTFVLRNSASAETAVTPTIRARESNDVAVRIASSALSASVLGAGTAQAYTTKTLAQSSIQQNSLNVITITLQPNVAMSDGDIITITGLTGTQTATTTTLTVGGTDAATFGSSAGWNIDGTLTLTVDSGQSVSNSGNTVVTITVANPAATQSAPTVSVASSGSVAISGQTMVGSVLDASEAQEFTTKTLAESSTIQHTANVLTITLRPNVALAPSDEITIVGLTGTQTADAGALTVAGADAARFGSAAAWTQSTGTLVLTVASAQSVSR
jgi:hypothetical protein